MSLPQPSPVLLAALPGLIALAIWAVRDVQRYVLFGVLSAMVLPTAILRPGGTQVALADLLLIGALAAWLIAGAAGTAPRPLLTNNRMLAPTLVFVAVNAESIAWSIDRGATARFAVQLLEIVVVIPIVFASLPRSVLDVRRAYMIFIAITCGLAALWLPYAAEGEFGHPFLPDGLNKNSVGSFIAAGLVIAFALWLGEQRRHIRLRLGLAAWLELAGLLATHSRGSIIGAFVGMVAVGLLVGRRRALMVIVAVAAAALFVAFNGLQTASDLSGVGAYDSTTVRVYSFKHAVRKIQDRPLLGSGGGTYSDYIEEVGIGLPDPNNMILLTLAELGIVGGLALVFLFWRFAALLLAVRRLPGELSFLAVGAGGAALQMFVHFQFDVTWTRGTASLAFAMIGLMLALQRLAQDAAREPAVQRDDAPQLALRAPAGVA